MPCYNGYRYCVSPDSSEVAAGPRSPPNVVLELDDIHISHRSVSHVERVPYLTMSFLIEDIVLLDATVIDGSGSEPQYEASIVIRNEHIQSIHTGKQPLSTDEIEKARKAGVRIVECNGWCLCPGFIDMHAHSDLSLLHTPDHLAKITQGVTTEVVGQDGISYSPVTEETMARIRKQIAGWNGKLHTT